MLHALPNRHRFEGCDGSVGCGLLREPYELGRVRLRRSVITDSSISAS